MKVDVLPTNCHLLIYHPEGCIGNCGFCPQSQYTHHQLSDTKQDQEYLSRVLWPAFDLDQVTTLFEQKFSKFDTSNTGFQRICIQSLNYDRFESDLDNLIHKLTRVTSIPISIAIPPVSQEKMKVYKKLGIDRICFAIDAATPQIFDSVKGKGCDGPYSWEEHIELLTQATEIFGRGYVSTHLIIGLGETEYEALHLIQEMKDLGILTGIFAFFPIKKTRFESQSRPEIVTFRKIQLGKYLIDIKKWNINDFTFDETGSITHFPIDQTKLKRIISLSSPFETSGCPGCNRPYYTSSPREEQYNYPRILKSIEEQQVFEELHDVCKEVDE